jgi:hypothetical protein
MIINKTSIELNLLQSVKASFSFHRYSLPLTEYSSHIMKGKLWQFNINRSIIISMDNGKVHKLDVKYPAKCTKLQYFHYDVHLQHACSYLMTSFLKIVFLRLFVLRGTAIACRGCWPKLYKMDHHLIKKKKKTPWLWSANEPCRPSERRFLAK